MNKKKTIEALFEESRDINDVADGMKRHYLALELHMLVLQDIYANIGGNGDYSPNCARFVEAYRSIVEALESPVEQMHRTLAGIPYLRDSIELEQKIDSCYNNPSVRSFTIRDLETDKKKGRGWRISQGIKIQKIIEEGIKEGRYQIKIISRQGNPTRYVKLNPPEKTSLPIDTADGSNEKTLGERLSSQEIYSILEENLDGKPFFTLKTAIDIIRENAPTDKEVTHRKIETAIKRKYKPIKETLSGNVETLYERTSQH